MNNKKILTIVLCIFIIMITLISFFIDFPQEKECAIIDENTTLEYNNSLYFQIPYDYDFDFGMRLLPNERIDLATFVEASDDFYLNQNEYFVYKGDDMESPNVIYKQNNGFGVSGWLYIKENFDYQSITIENSTVVEIFVDNNPVAWTTNSQSTINEITNAIFEKEDLVPIIAEYTKKPWIQLFVRCEGSPFVQKIGWQENGKFQYNTEGPTTRRDGSSVSNESNN